SATSSCIALTIAKASPTLGLTVSPAVSPMTAGGSATGSATLSGAASAARGDRPYPVYSDAPRATQVTATGNPSTVTVVNRSVPNSAAITIANASTVYWKVTYAGDPNNNSAASTCVALTVAKKSPDLTLTVSPAVLPMVVGGTATGTATLS